MNKIFLDSNILLDISLERMPEAEHGAQIVNLCESEVIEVFASSLSFSHVYYTTAKIVGKHKSVSSLKIFYDIISVLPVSKSIIQKALYSDFSDFEDAIQYYCAIQEKNMGAIVTNNVKDFSKADIPVMTAKTFLHLHAK